MADLGIPLKALNHVPGFKCILRAIIKNQIQILVDQLANQTGEQSVILTVDIGEKSFSQLGSQDARGFLKNKKSVQTDFLKHCAEKYKARHDKFEESPNRAETRATTSRAETRTSTTDAETGSPSVKKTRLSETQTNTDRNKTKRIKSGRKRKRTTEKECNDKTDNKTALQVNNITEPQANVRTADGCVLVLENERSQRDGELQCVTNHSSENQVQDTAINNESDDLNNTPYNKYDGTNETPYNVSEGLNHPYTESGDTVNTPYHKYDGTNETPYNVSKGLNHPFTKSDDTVNTPYHNSDGMKKSDSNKIIQASTSAESSETVRKFTGKTGVEMDGSVEDSLVERSDSGDIESCDNSDGGANRVTTDHHYNLNLPPEEESKKPVAGMKRAKTGRKFISGQALNEDLRTTIILQIMEEGGDSTSGNVPRGVFTRVSKKLKINSSSVSRLWERYISDGTIKPRQPVNKL